jgi:hypothetical protein
MIAVTLLLAACATAPTPAVTDPEIDTTLRDVYAVISGPAGPRDWERFRDMFAQGARLISVRNGAANVMTPEDYIARAGAYFDKNGFFERSTSNRVERFQNIAHVFSRYESRHGADDATPFARGTNSFQLVRIGDRWKILTILWEEEPAR